jgi:Fungal Zn(2)-Cys(6) binuclear cluster domain
MADDMSSPGELQDGQPQPQATQQSQKRKASAAGLDGTVQSRPVKRRASKACQCCRARKVRCNVTEHGAPCTNCRLDEVECIVSESRRKKSVDTLSPFPPKHALCHPRSSSHGRLHVERDQRQHQDIPSSNVWLASVVMSFLELHPTSGLLGISRLREFTENGTRMATFRQRPTRPRRMLASFQLRLATPSMGCLIRQMPRPNCGHMIWTVLMNTSHTQSVSIPNFLDLEHGAHGLE